MEVNKKNSIQSKTQKVFMANTYLQQLIFVRIKDL